MDPRVSEQRNLAGNKILFVVNKAPHPPPFYISVYVAIDVLRWSIRLSGSFGKEWLAKSTLFRIIAEEIGFRINNISECRKLI